MLVGRVFWVYLWVYLSSSDKAIGTLIIFTFFFLKVQFKYLGEERYVSEVVNLSNLMTDKNSPQKEIIGQKLSQS